MKIMNITGNRALKFAKDWILPISMASGIILYLIYHWLPEIHAIGPAVHKGAIILQPILIFVMLFLQFNKISPHDLKLRWWHLAIAAAQGGIFLALAYIVYSMQVGLARTIAECAMLCFITPTAAAAGVITEKLGGSLTETMSYVVIANCMAALLVPSVIPFLHPTDGRSFLAAMWMISAKVFPMLIMPCIAAWIVRYTFRKMQVFLMRYTGMAFYLWSFSLVISLALTTRTFLLSHMPVYSALIIGIVSLICCIMQFWLGQKIGNSWDKPTSVTAGQSFGQKNTVFEIWLGYTFLTPETSICGGFYCIWHNLVNSWELLQAQNTTHRS